MLLGDEVAPLDLELAPWAGVETVLGEDGDATSALLDNARRNGDRLPLAELTPLAPIPFPRKVFAVGLNYGSHLAETGLPQPEVPTIFAKYVNSISGPRDPIQRPRVSEALDYEGELAVVIGRRCRHVPRDRAHEAIAGYFVLNDVSVRDWQKQSQQWSLAKSFDTHAPTGPWLTFADAIEPENLELRTLVNGELRQQANTGDLVFDPLDLVAYLSQACTLEPGDIIATGTPGGVGFLMDPPRYLTPGDEVRVEIEGLGALVNKVIEEPADSGHIGDEVLSFVLPGVKL
jgi:2-keto-4-pentenoate hydratase/2-oxohepta-3-ene-1,7-dioic acid hydratase in catechol pathway